MQCEVLERVRSVEGALRLVICSDLLSSILNVPAKLCEGH